MNERFRRSLVALSGDPFTFGHLDLIRQALQISENVVVLVAVNDDKKGRYTYALEERTAMARRAIAEAGLANVRVIGSDGLATDVWLAEGCDGFIRGIRNDNDRAFEKELAEINIGIEPQLEDKIKLIDANSKFRLVSSSLVKDLVRLRKDVDAFVPMFVKQSLEEKLLEQYRLGITGEIASGKSRVAEELVAAARKAGLPSDHINVDEILRQLYDEDSAGAQIVRDELAKRFGAGVLATGGKTVNRPVLAAVIFDAAAYADRKFVVDLTMPHVYRLYRKALAHARGLVVVEWAQMAEMRMSAMTNHNVIVVSSPDRDKFIAARGLDAERIAAMSRLQFAAPDKKIMLESAAKAARSGDVIAYENRFRTDLKNPDPALLHLLDYLTSTIFPGLKSLKK